MPLTLSPYLNILNHLTHSNQYKTLSVLTRNPPNNIMNNIGTIIPIAAVAYILKLELIANARVAPAVVIKHRLRKKKKNFPASIWNPEMIILLSCVGNCFCITIDNIEFAKRPFGTLKYIAFSITPTCVII